MLPLSPTQSIRQVEMENRITFDAFRGRRSPHRYSTYALAITLFCLIMCHLINRRIVFCRKPWWGASLLVHLRQPGELRRCSWQHFSNSLVNVPPDAFIRESCTTPTRAAKENTCSTTIVGGARLATGNSSITSIYIYISGISQ